MEILMNVRHDLIAVFIVRETRNNFPSPGTPGEGKGGGFSGGLEKPPPLPSPGVPEEGEKFARGEKYEFLQMRRAASDYLGGSWQTVLGQIETGETAVAAALRELKEEVGLVPMEFYQLDQVSVFFIASRDTIYHCVQFCAFVSADSKVTLNEEHDAFRWLAANEAEPAFLWPGDRQGVREILSQILTNGPSKSHMRIMPPAGSEL
jgi:dATP pyrophosphohydrolase